jgi:hypothetical protein
MFPIYSAVIYKPVAVPALLEAQTDVTVTALADIRCVVCPPLRFVTCSKLTGPPDDSGGKSPASHSEGPASILGTFMWDLRQTKWHSNRLFSQYFSFPLLVLFHQCSTHIHSSLSDAVLSQQLV